MKPFSARRLPDEERIYNYRLSRARRVVENAFGIMANRFGCLLTTMSQNPETVTSIVLACCMLHTRDWVMRRMTTTELSQDSGRKVLVCRTLRMWLVATGTHRLPRDRDCI